MISIQPVISIIIPVFNAIESLERCVESVVYGSFRDIELILIDDCSTDGSWKLCQILSEKYSNVYSFHNSENKGVSFTRNRGLKQVKSDYVMFIDSDDWVSGKYVQSLFDIIIQYPECLPVCGYFFIDQIAERKETYIFQNKYRGSDLFETEDLFDLFANVQIQQLWNKLFRRDIIEKYKIQFNEQQSMGEDFQFVLDYLNASGIKKCVVLPKPLYYYVRANNDSLMSKFGMIETENEYKRLKQMLVLCGEENTAYKNKYIRAVETAKFNHVYKICRSSLLKKREKLNLIEKEMNDSHAAAYYRQQKKQLFKENLLDKKKAITHLPKRLKGKLIRTRNARIISRADALLKNRDFSLISQNCIGGVFYHDMNLQFKSPTIDLFFKADDFVRFASRLEYYLRQDLQMYWDEEYPVGILDDVKVFFMHYNSCSEAKETWQKRLLRLQKDRIVVIATDMEGFDNACFEKWKQITYPKVLYSASVREDDSCVYYSEYEARGCVPDLIPKREFYKDNVLIHTVNSFEAKLYSS